MGPTWGRHSGALVSQNCNVILSNFLPRLQKGRTFFADSTTPGLFYITTLNSGDLLVDLIAALGTNMDNSSRLSVLSSNHNRRLVLRLNRGVVSSLESLPPQDDRSSSRGHSMANFEDRLVGILDRNASTVLSAERRLDRIDDR